MEQTIHRDHILDDVLSTYTYEFADTNLRLVRRRYWEEWINGPGVIPYQEYIFAHEYIFGKDDVYFTWDRVKLPLAGACVDGLEGDQVFYLTDGRCAYGVAISGMRPVRKYKFVKHCELYNLTIYMTVYYMGYYKHSRIVCDNSIQHIRVLAGEVITRYTADAKGNYYVTNADRAAKIVADVQGLYQIIEFMKTSRLDPPPLEYLPM